MSRFRILDGNAAGYMRTPVGTVGKTQDAQSMQSPVLNEAMAVMYRGYTPTASPVPPGPDISAAFSRWRLRAASNQVPGGGTGDWIINQLEMRDENGLDVSLDGGNSTADTSVVNPAILFNKAGSWSTGPWVPALGHWVQFNLSAPRKVRRIVLTNYHVNYYMVPRYDVLASNDGTTWTLISQIFNNSYPIQDMTVAPGATVGG